MAVRIYDTSEKREVYCMELNNEERLPLLENEETVETESEPDLNSTTFFPDKDALASEELSFSQKVDRINTMLLANGLNRPMLYRILAAVKESPLPFEELEARIQTMPEFTKATQPPSALIEWLQNVEAVVIIEVNEEGAAITEEDIVGLSEDEIDDLIFDLHVAISEYGKESFKSFNPEDGLAEIASEWPSRYDTYKELLEFFKQKRTYNEVDQLLRGRPILLDGLVPGSRPMQPSVFVDKLASVGAIVFDGGWVITPEGLHFLEGA